MRGLCGKSVEGKRDAAEGERVVRYPHAPAGAGGDLQERLARRGGVEAGP